MEFRSLFTTSIGVVNFGKGGGGVRCRLKEIGDSRLGQIGVIQGAFVVGKLLVQVGL
jgi:hypothetical protein